MSLRTIRSNHIFLRNLVQRFVGPASLQNHVNLRDEVFHSPYKGRHFQFSDIYLQRSKTTESNDNAEEYSLLYIFLILNSKMWFH